MSNDSNQNQKLLSERMRPSLKNIHLLQGKAKQIWHRDLQQWHEERPFHMVLWGPPGSGKTTCAKLLAEKSESPFVTLSAVRDGVKEIRCAIDNHKIHWNDNQKPLLLFIDEIHRLNKAQQDSLLPILEYSEAWVIGATTESPTTCLNAAILSRIRTIYIPPISKQDIIQALNNAILFLEAENHKTIFTHLQSTIIPKIAQMNICDLRYALNLFESIYHAKSLEEIDEIFTNSLRSFTTKDHYDIISAMIKSMRGSDPDAALFYAFDLIDKGEDPLFLLRRCIIFASEDVGNADPQALILANSAYQAIQFVGMPEGRLILSQCICYLASTQKSNKSTIAIDKITQWKQQAQKNGENIDPPIAITLKGKNEYQYPHDHENAFVLFKYLPTSIQQLKDKDKKPAYLPSSFGFEKFFLERLSKLWKK